MAKKKSDKAGFGKLLDAWTPPSNAGEPIGCVATSFTFSPAFFEEECLGRFLGLESDPVEDGPAYLIEREEKLHQIRCASALVDQRHARGARSLRWDLLSARMRNGAIQHSKISILLWAKHCRLIVGSANLTEDGYRRNQEIFGVVDYTDGSDALLACLTEILVFLDKAADHVGVTEDGARQEPAVERWRDFLNHVRQRTRNWGREDSSHKHFDVRVHSVLTGPGLPNLFENLGRIAPGGGPPSEAWIVSPFFNPPDARNHPAEEIWKLMRRRGEATVNYDVTVEEVPGKEKTLFVHAPESLLKAQPSRESCTTNINKLLVEDGRPLHAKSIWIQNDNNVLYLIGSSNFTSNGTGLARYPNLEANLAYTVARGSIASTMSKSSIETEKIPKDVELFWKPRGDDGDDSSGGDVILLPPFFASCVLTATAGAMSLEVMFVGEPPAVWQVLDETEDEILLTCHSWNLLGCPDTMSLAWRKSRPPSVLAVRWKDSEGTAWWPVNVRDASVLPTPDDLKDLPLEALIDILTSNKPLSRAISKWIEKRRKADEENGEKVNVDLDPHRRVDTTSFLLQRTRRVSWAFSALRQRLERPVASIQSLWWRLRGPVGVKALSDAVMREARSAEERVFLNVELILELHQVRPSTEMGMLAKAEVAQGIRDVMCELRGRITDEDLASSRHLATYANAVFTEAGL